MADGGQRPAFGMASRRRGNRAMKAWGAICACSAKAVVGKVVRSRRACAVTGEMEGDQAQPDRASAATSSPAK